MIPKVIECNASSKLSMFDLTSEKVFELHSRLIYIEFCSKIFLLSRNTNRAQVLKFNVNVFSNIITQAHCSLTVSHIRAAIHPMLCIAEFAMATPTVQMIQKMQNFGY